MAKLNSRLAAMIASDTDFVSTEVTECLIVLLDHFPDEYVLEINRSSASVLAGRLDPIGCQTIEGFVETHRKVIGLILESLDSVPEDEN